MALFQPRLSWLILLVVLTLHVALSQPSFATEPSGLFQPRDEEVIETVTAKEMLAKLKKRGFKVTHTVSDDDTPYIFFQTAGNDTLVLLYDCEKEQCSIVKMVTLFSGTPLPSFDQINIFNHYARYVRAYTDDDTAFVESDMSLDGGLSVDAIDGFVTRHQTMSAFFAEHIGRTFDPADQYRWSELTGEQPDTVMLKRKGKKIASVSKSQAKAKQKPVEKKSIVKKKVKKAPATAKQAPDPSSGFVFEVLASRPDDGLYPVILKLYNKTQWDIVKLMVPIRITYENEEGKQSRDVTYQYPDVVAGESSTESIWIPVKSISQIKQVAIRWIADCNLIGDPAAQCDDMVTALPSTRVPIRLPSGAIVNGSTIMEKEPPQPKPQPIKKKIKKVVKPVQVSAPEKLRVSLVSTMEQIEGMGCPLGLEVVNHTTHEFSELEMVVRFRQQGGVAPLDEQFDLGALQPGGKAMAFKLLESDCGAFESAALQAISRCTGEQGRRLGCANWIEISESNLIPLTHSR